MAPYRGCFKQNLHMLHPTDPETPLAWAIALSPLAPSGNETPSRTSWSYFFTKAAAEHPLVVATEDHIEKLFKLPEIAGPRPKLFKTEALQGEQQQLWQAGKGKSVGG
jgi:hypothetical protein